MHMHLLLRRSRSLLGVVSLTLLATLGVSGAAPPDLSGTWVFDKAKSEVAANSQMAGHLVITQKDPHVRIAMFGADGKPGFTLDFVTDGKPASNTLGMPQTSSARWDGDTLIVAWNQASGASGAAPAANAASAPPAPGAAPQRARRAVAAFNWNWKLGPGSDTLINEVEMNPGPDASGEKWVFVRKGR
jgi:hypothetical protein